MFRLPFAVRRSPRLHPHAYIHTSHPRPSKGFFQLHWGLERVLTGVAMAVMPFECRPDVEQHIVGYAGTNDRPVKVAVRPDGNVVLLSDGGLTSWFLRIEGESSVGRLEADTATGNSPADIAVLEPWTPPKRPFVAITIPMTSNKLGITTAEDSPLMRIVLPSLMRALSTDLVKFNVVVYAGMLPPSPPSPPSPHLPNNQKKTFNAQR